MRRDLLCPRCDGHRLSSFLVYVTEAYTIGDTNSQKYIYISGFAHNFPINVKSRRILLCSHFSLSTS